MNALAVNFEKYIPNIIDAFVQVYGDEYRETITKRINSILYVIYNNLDGISSYYDFLSTCKKQELSLEFLSQIGIDISKCKDKSYAEPLDEDINKLIHGYIDGITWSFEPMFLNHPDGIKAFKTIKEDIPQESILNGQLKFLNFYRGKDVESLTLETLEIFKQTDEYSEILNKIKGYLRIHSHLFAEYEQYLETIKEYRDYAEEEKKRCTDLLEIKGNEFYNSIELDLPDAIKNILDNNCTNNNAKARMLFNDDLIWRKLYIEYFSQEDEDKINHPMLKESEKQWIYYYRLKFFKSLGIDVDLLKETDNYNEFIQREDIKPLIPSAKFIKQFTKSKEEKHEEAIKEFIYASKTFADNTQRFANNPDNYEAIYSRIKDNMVCMTGGNDVKDNFIPVLFFTITSGAGGKLDYLFLHELGHVIEADSNQVNGYRSGFDYVIGDISSNNSYNTEKREYERMDEIFADIFAIEARNLLHEKGIYFADIPAHTVYDVKDYNTCSLLKNMVAPLLDQFRPQIIQARLFGKIKQLCDVIGIENYEELNDSINKVDSLLDKGLYGKLKDNKNPLVIEYNSQLARVKRIYTNIGVLNSKESQIPPKH